MILHERDTQDRHERRKRGRTDKKCVEQDRKEKNDKAGNRNEQDVEN